jgi:hypothetical protein
VVSTGQVGFKWPTARTWVSNSSFSSFKRFLLFFNHF